MKFLLLPRRSFRNAEAEQNNSAHDQLYMAVTASAKAKTRSLNTPKQRLESHDRQSNLGESSRRSNTKILHHDRTQSRQNYGISLSSSYDAESISKNSKNGWGSLADMLKQYHHQQH
ncbi:hypothetical protein ACFX1R_010226 [Malus domestica]